LSRDRQACFALKKDSENMQSKMIATVLILLLAGESVATANSLENSNNTGNSIGQSLQLRPNIKQYVDQLRAFALIGAAHTTDSLSLLNQTNHRNQIADDPKPFPAGRYRIEFRKGADIKIILVQTENKVGHYVTVIPGKISIDGYVQLFNDQNEAVPSGPRLTRDEIDYLLRMIYSKCYSTSVNNEFVELNKLKDMLLAVLFSSAQDVQDYHHNLISQFY